MTPGPPAVRQDGAVDPKMVRIVAIVLLVVAALWALSLVAF